jgi:hypothetical protein
MNKTAPSFVHRPSDALSEKSRKTLGKGYEWAKRKRAPGEVLPATRPLVNAQPGDLPRWPDTRAGSMRAFSIPSHGVRT